MGGLKEKVQGEKQNLTKERRIHQSVLTSLRSKSSLVLSNPYGRIDTGKEVRI